MVNENQVDRKPLNHHKLTTMKILKPITDSLKAVQGVFFANEGTEVGGKKFDFRKMVMSLLGANEHSTDDELEEMANSAMKDDTDYGAMKDKAATNETAIVDLTAKIAGHDTMLATLTTERDAANAKLVNAESVITTATTNLNAAVVRATKAEADFANETAKLVTLTAEKDATVTKLTASEQLVANERKQFADSYVTLGIESGRISASDKPTWEKDFANAADCSATAARLVKLPAKWKTTTSVNGLGSRSSESLTRTEKVLARVNEVQAANGKDGKDSSYEFCFAQVKKEMASEFDQMTQSEASRNHGKKK